MPEDESEATVVGVAHRRRPRAVNVEPYLEKARQALDASKSLRTSPRPTIAPVVPSVYFDAEGTLAKLREIRAEIRADFEDARRSRAPTAR